MEQATPLVSVIIPCYNAQTHVKHAVESVLAQTHANVQAVVVNDGSTDSTATEIAALQAADNRVVGIQHETNRGSFAARITGIEAATGQFIAFLDADDALAPDALETCLAKKTDEGEPFDIVQFSFDLDFNMKMLACDREGRERACTAPAETLHGGEITHMIFNEQRASWSLCGKLFNASIVKRAAAALPAVDGLTMAEDALLCFCICCHAGTYTGIPQLHGYRYSIDAGESGANSRRISLQQFGKYAQYARAMQVMGDFAKQFGDGAYLADYEAARNAHIDMSVIKLADAVALADRQAAFDMLVKNWGIVDIVSRLVKRYGTDARGCLKELGLTHLGSCEQSSNDHTSNATESAVGQKPIETIAVYHHRLHGDQGAFVAASLAGMYRDMGYRVVVLADEEPNPADFATDGNSATDADSITRITLPRPNIAQAEDYLPRAVALSQAVAQHDIDALVYCDYASDLLTWDMMIVQNLGACFIAHTQSALAKLYGNQTQHEAAIATSLRFANGIVTESPLDAQFWRSVNPNTFETQPFVAAPESAHATCTREAKRIAWIGDASDGGDQPAEALRITALVHELHPDAKLAFIGANCDKQSAKALRKQAREMGINGCVEFAGEPSGTAGFAAQLKECSIMLETSSFDGGSMALAQGKAAGLPCIMYALPYQPLSAGEHGVVSVAQGNAKAAAYAISDLLDSPERYQLLSNQAYNHAAELAAFDHTAAWRKILAAVAANGKRNDAAPLAIDGWTMADVLSCGAAATAKSASELADVKGSTTYKVGNAIMAIPCKLKDMARRH